MCAGFSITVGGVSDALAPKGFTISVPRCLEATARPGDLVFFKGTYKTNGVSHVGIYVGENRMIHCGNPISYTNINTQYWQSHFFTFGCLP